MLLGLEVREGRRRPEVGDEVLDAGSGPLFFTLCATAVVIGVVAIVAVPSWRIPGGWYAFEAGVALVLAGMGLRLWASAVLGRFHLPVVTIQKDHKLVSSGPYAVVRHPIYAGLLLSMAGLGAMLGTWSSLSASVVLPLIGAVRRITVEEKVMASALGDAYGEYAANRSRLVPGIW
jgi:protein-S-isoprenylcysteine O-methyltransferase Ste14